MRAILSLFSLFAAVVVLAEEPRLLPPGITKEKAAEGWIALFDGETTCGLKVDPGMKLEKGALVLGGGTTLETTTHFAAFEVEIDYRVEGNTGEFTFHYSDGSIGKKVNSTSSEEQPLGFHAQVPENKKAGPLKIAVHSGTTLYIRSLIVKPLGAQSIFNGKDLTGWKEIPGHKSKYTVTSAGELNVKDGNGDIQTEGQWDDFILQLDVISNGDHLNSGVFFRCLPGDFWSGYEAQVRNEWETEVVLKDGGPTLKGSYTEKGDQVEMKVGRETMRFGKSDIAKKIDHRDRPVDFGTGALYNRVKARRVVSTDREYFTMTVIAHGNHLAVWVNGYQTAEHTDTRAVNDSARRGRKDGAGCISLQGHDPTTDLSFKNIRVAPLAKAAP